MVKFGIKLNRQMLEKEGFDNTEIDKIMEWYNEKRN